MICPLAYVYLAIAVAVQRQQEAGSDLDAGLTPVTVLELLRLLRDTIIPVPARPAPPAALVHLAAPHQHRARQAHQRWNAFAETTP